MNTSHTTPALFSPIGDDRIPDGVFEYLQTRNRMRVFTTVQNEFVGSGITQSTLAKRMGKGTDRVCHLLGAPGNWTLDTASDVIFAISGGVLNYQISYPLAEPPRNLHRPEWLESGNSGITITSEWANQQQSVSANLGASGTFIMTSASNYNYTNDASDKNE